MSTARSTVYHRVLLEHIETIGNEDTGSVQGPLMYQLFVQEITTAKLQVFTLCAICK